LETQQVKGLDLRRVATLAVAGPALRALAGSEAAPPSFATGSAPDGSRY
jgi:hypothetical protein